MSRLIHVGVLNTNTMKKFIFTLLVAIAPILTNAQYDCNIGNNKSQNFIGGGGCTGGNSGDNITISGNYAINIGNNSILHINGVIKITGDLTVNFQSNSGELCIPADYSLNAKNLIITGNPTEKVLEVDGTQQVEETLDFNNKTIEVDGSGSIVAGAITGAQNVTCAADFNCPYVFTPSCNDGSGEFCNDIQSQPPLPLTLKSFDVKILNDEVSCNWVSEVELNFNYYEIEKSTDGISFYAIKKIYGQTNEQSTKYYQFNDDSQNNQIVYYRLKMVDNDNSFEYSDVKVIYPINNNNKLRIYPNPLQQGMNTLKVMNLYPEITQLDVVDTRGVLIIRKNIENGENAIELNLNLVKGYYTLLFYGKERLIQTEKLLVI